MRHAQKSAKLGISVWYRAGLRLKKRARKISEPSFRSQGLLSSRKLAFRDACNNASGKIGGGGCFWWFFFLKGMQAFI